MGAMTDWVKRVLKYAQMLDSATLPDEVASAAENLETVLNHSRHPVDVRIELCDDEDDDDE